MTKPTPLSPAAQAVLDSTMGLAATVREAQAVAAAALRAAADNLTPKTVSNVRLLYELLHLADELEGFND